MKKMLDWLGSVWAIQWHADWNPWKAGHGSVSLQSRTQVGWRRNVLGEKILRLREIYQVALCLTKDGDGADNLDRVREFMEGLRENPMLKGENCLFWPGDGHLVRDNGQGLAQYTVRLVWEYDETE